MTKMDELLERLTNAVVSKKSSTSNDDPTFSAKGPEARHPDKFEGTAQSKLRPFALQCRLVFLNHPKRFATDRSKVLYAGSLLNQRCCRLVRTICLLDNGPETIVLDSWRLFEDRITKMFGDPNVESNCWSTSSKHSA